MSIFVSPVLLESTRITSGYSLMPILLLDDTVGMLLWSGGEGVATIICASISVLRPLYMALRRKGESSSDRTPAYPLSDIPQDSSKPRRLPDATLFDGTEGFETMVAAGAENESERSILRSENGAEQHHGIKREVEVEVTFQTKGEARTSICSLNVEQRQ